MDLFHLNKDYEQISWITGKNGGGRQILDIDILELPDGMYWVQEGDFIITMGYFLTTSDVRFENFVRMLIRNKASGLGVKLGRFFDTIPDKALKLAEENDFPIINYPLHMGYKTMTRPVLNYLVGEDQYTSYTLKNYKKELNSLVKAGYEVAVIMEQLKRYINHEIYLLWENRSGFIYKTSEAGSGEVRELLEKNGFCSTGSDGRVEYKMEKGKLQVYRVGAREQNLAFLCVSERGYRRLTDTDVEIIRETLPYIIIYLYSETRLGQYKGRSREMFFMDILDGNYDKREGEMLRNAKALGIVPESPRCFAGVPIRGMSTTETDRMYRKIALYLDSRKISYTLHSTGEKILILLELGKKYEGPKMLEPYFKELLTDLRESFRNDKLCLFISKIYEGLKEIAYSYEEINYLAECHPKKNEGMLYYEDYMMDHLLHDLGNQAAAERIYEEVLGKLNRYDERNNSEMKRTLAVLASNDYNLSQAAEVLYVHRNTLYKRVEKLEHILGFDLGEPDIRLLIHLVMRSDMVCNVHTVQQK